MRLSTMTVLAAWLVVSGCECGGPPVGGDGGTGGGRTGGGSGVTGGGSAASGGGTGTTGGGSAATGGGSAATGGGSAATGGGSAATGGGSAATGGGSTATGGGSAATGGGSAATGGGSAATGGGSAASGGGSASTGGGSGTGGGMAPCVFTPAPANGARKVVVSHPYQPDAGKNDLFEVYTLSTTGTLSATGQTFRMGRAGDFENPIIFTPDGRIGYAVQEGQNGFGTSIGIFRFDAETNGVVVVERYWKGLSTVRKILLDAEGDGLWIFDGNVIPPIANNNGGLYHVDIACDGSLFNERYVFPGNQAFAGALVPGQSRLVVAANGSLGPISPGQVFVVDTGASPALVRGGSNAFNDGGITPASISVSRDSKWVALPDNSLFGGQRVGWLELSGNAAIPRQINQLTGLYPVSVTFSPLTDTALLVTTDGPSSDGFRRVTYTSAGAFTVPSSPMSYAHGKPELPGVPSLITRGTLTGLMLIPEVEAIRQLRFESDGGITDVAKFVIDGGNVPSVGTLGVTP